VVGDRILINGLAIDDGPKVGFPKGMTTVRAYYEAFLIGGPGAFALSIASFEEMHQRLAEKLAREICWNPNS
jgi:hypothetical protein